MSLSELYPALLAGGVVLLASVVAARIATRLGLPSLLLFLGVGVLIGEDVLGVRFDDAQLAQSLGIAALAVILVEGGLSTRWADVRRLITPAGILATLGVAVSVGVTAAGAHLLLGFEWQLALLLGAIVVPTDAAAVFSVLRRLPLPRRVAGLLEAESGFNDAPAVILVLLFSEPITKIDPLGLTGLLAYELAAGAAIGLVAGRIGAIALRRIELPAAGLYPLAIFGLGIVAFAAAGAAHASGFLAAYLAGLVLANSGLSHQSAVRSFAEGLGWLAQIGLFVLLGLLVDPTELNTEFVSAVILGLVLLLVARPVSVLVSLTPFRIPLREQAFLSVAGLRGAIPIVLATFPVVAGVPGSDRIFNLVFVLVVIFTVVQGPTLPTLARRLGLVRPQATREIQIDSAPLDTLDANLITTSIPPDSRLHGVRVHELRLPEPAAITLIIREESAFVPRPDTMLRAGDELLIVATGDTRDRAERRLRAVSRRGRLARWFGEHGELDPA